jgi:hypothetical protein
MLTEQGRKATVMIIAIRGSESSGTSAKGADSATQPAE